MVNIIFRSITSQRIQGLTALPPIFVISLLDALPQTIGRLCSAEGRHRAGMALCRGGGRAAME